ncbi:antirestriction protein [Phyllobacterium brassicacearum]|uniref:Antirestriction protein n=1 Tax=Phyllobacterium brassicacearum TaxID=314235 RepID=A0A2P7B5Q1_9HYPH|nr:zincin-like metallopeptidase domain-containing protein [Phyllobacterium brassicacearum]PSH61750.1 antirestriction protein [Phyllobacterium brassicacearum]TDQ15316.1 antirestriction protein ArdC [Phyllobacterium brassicacearum]
MTKPDTTPRADIYVRITARIIEQLEAGTRPWMQPWGACGSPVRPLRHNGVAYRGINTVLLWMEAAEKGYQSPFWMTYKQAHELGGQVRKGERSTLVIYANAIERKEEDEQGEEVERRIPYLKGYSVFNTDQIEGLPADYSAKAKAPDGLQAKARIPRVDAFYGNLGADICEGGNQAYYRIDADFIAMPVFEAFVSAEAHAATLGHECIHWTRHETRLNRDLGRKAWGDEGYAREELVAELGSVFLAADLGLAIEPRDDHAAYISGWLKVLKNDRRAIFQAASHAERAVAFLHSLQPVASTQTEVDEENRAAA